MGIIFPVYLTELVWMGGDFSHYMLNEAWKYFFFPQVPMIGWKWIIPFSSLFLPQKLINISSEVMNIHIIPTQTKHFQTSYTKKVLSSLQFADPNEVHGSSLLWFNCCYFLWFNAFLSVFSQVSTHSRSRVYSQDPILSWWVALLLWLHSGSLQGEEPIFLALKDTYFNWWPK